MRDPDTICFSGESVKRIPVGEIKNKENRLIYLLGPKQEKKTMLYPKSSIGLVKAGVGIFINEIYMKQDTI